MVDEPGRKLEQLDLVSVFGVDAYGPVPEAVEGDWIRGVRE
jgi:hypothetical protein